MKIRSRIKTLIAVEEQNEGRVISSREISRKSGVSTSTISNMAVGKTRRIDLHVLESILKYFRDEWGRNYSLDDLFEIVEGQQDGRNN